MIQLKTLINNYSSHNTYEDEVLAEGRRRLRPNPRPRVGVEDVRTDSRVAGSGASGGESPLVLSAGMDSGLDRTGEVTSEVASEATSEATSEVASSRRDDSRSLRARIPRSSSSVTERIT